VCAAYVGLAWHFWTGRARGWEREAILLPLALHGWLIYDMLFAAPELRFGFAQALSVMVWLAVVIVWIEGLFVRADLLFGMALAAAAVCAPLTAFFPGRVTPDAYSFAFKLHLVVGMLAYSLFVVATLHAVLISVVERRLHSAPTVIDPATPPLLTLETWVFRLTAAAFIVLTVTLVVGVAYSESLFGKAMRFDHKTLFVLLSWLTFGGLLAGRWRYGWRGRTALRWTVSGFVMLMLAYPGSRFVLEVILHRS
jgi:ABC-type uncharacterized transport system permease subunit